MARPPIALPSSMLRSLLRSGFVVRPVGAMLLAALATACASGGAGVATGAANEPSAASVWPAIPRAEGPLTIRVQYPAANAVVAARDSTFLLGTVNHGAATLTINGAPVAVRPNGAFLAWVAMPPRGRAQFDLVAATPGGEPRTLSLPIRLPAERRPVDASRPYVDTTSITPRANLALRGDEPVRVSARLAAGARAEFRPAACGGAAMNKKKQKNFIYLPPILRRVECALAFHHLHPPNNPLPPACAVILSKAKDPRFPFHTPKG